MTQQQFPCGQCGATLEFKPGELALVCEYCGHSNPIEAAEAAIEELDYRAFLEDASAKEATEERLTVKCDGCGAESTLAPNVASDECPFCGSAIVTTQSSQKVLKPQSVLPFKVKRKEAFEAFQKWLHGLWFAPNALKKKARPATKNAYRASTCPIGPTTPTPIPTTAASGERTTTSRKVTRRR